MKNKPKLFKIHRDGYIFTSIFALISLLAGWMFAPLGWIFLILTFWCIYFFRDPDRVTPTDDKNIVSPADGVVSKIEEVQLPAELGMGKDEVVRISIFLSVFNCHVNRVPASGKITKILYHPGKFFNAALDKASIHNERNLVAMELKNGKKLVFTQIAGLIARRIVCNLDNGQQVEAGQRYGIIRFGSRMDIYLPKGELAQVIEGQNMVAGETILARIGSKEKIKGTIQ